MCLTITPKTRLRTARKDIVCYKVLISRYGKLVSPYYSETEWEVGKTNVEEKRWDVDYCSNVFADSYFRVVGKGGFHTLANRKDAEKFLRVKPNRGHEPNRRHNIVVVECVIPKGTKYYTGTQGMTDDGYCSKSLRIEKIL